MPRQSQNPESQAPGEGGSYEEPQADEPQTSAGTSTDRPASSGGQETQASAYLPDGTPMDNVGIVRATVKNPLTGQDQEVTAAATNPDQVVTGAAGQRLPAEGGELGAPFVRETLAPKPVQTQPAPAALVERWLKSPLYRALAPAIGRGPLDLGLIGKDQTVIGHMILMDAESGELVRVLPGTKIEDDRLFVNTRNLPEFLVANPDLAKSAVGGGAGG